VRACRRFWTKYQTDEYRDSIAGYNDKIPQLRELKVEVPVLNVLDDSDLSYSFPFSRTPPHNSSMLEQCHALLRASAFSMPLAEFAGSERDEGMLTLPVLERWLLAGEEWKPLSKGAVKNARSREDMIHALMHTGEIDNGLAGLYDARFRHLGSRFCAPNGSAPQPPRAMRVALPDLPDLLPPQTGTANTPAAVRMHGPGARNVGAARRACPCEPAGGDGACRISRAVCRLGAAALSGLPNDLCDAAAVAAAAAAAEPGSIAYAARHAPAMRAVLDAFSAELKADPGFVCSLHNVSDLWGVLPARVAQYHDAAHTGELSTPARSLLLHTRSGATLSNILDIDRQIHAELGEGDRAVRFESADGGARVDNVLCEAHPAHARLARLGFPAVSAVAESPVVVDCLRYILEVSWQDMLGEVAPGDGGVASVALQQMQTDSEVHVARWEQRCSIKLRKLDTCRHQGAYSAALLQTLAPPEPAAGCPFSVAAGAAHALLPSVCLVVDAAGRFFDPRLCAQQAGGAVPAASLAAACEVASPLALLRAETEAVLARTPLLSPGFARGVIAAGGGGSRTGAGGVLGLRPGEDFLFPSEAHDYAEAVCFPTVPYWPVAWQAPFGEVVADSYRHATGFASYTLLECEDDDADCARGRVLVLPDHLRDENLTSQHFGAGGFCREHSFAMPMLHTNTHAVCADDAPLTSATHAALPVLADKCSRSADAHAGGGPRAAAGNLWPLLRHLVQPDAALGYTVSDAAVRALLLALDDGAGDAAPFAIAPRLDAGEDMHAVVRDLCRHRDNYEVVAEASDAARTAPGGQECNKNGHCALSRGEVCAADGRCWTVEVEATNHLLHPVEVGVAVDGSACSANSARPRPSPWERYAALLQQHGMCSHSNAVTYQRMAMAMQSAAFCDPRSALPERVPGAAHECARAGVVWDWDTEIPWATSGARAGGDPRMLDAGATVDDAHAFLLEKHPCDAEYMHSTYVVPDAGGAPGALRDDAERAGLHMCALGLAGAGGPTSTWMRASRNRAGFATMALTAPDAAGCFGANKALNCQDPTRVPGESETANKLRFMSLEADSINFATDSDDTRLLQTCGSLGVCQPEYFTLGGVPAYRYSPDSPPSRPRAAQNTKDCSSVGFLASGGGGAGGAGPPVSDGDTVCTLDPQTAALPYMLRLGAPEYRSCAALFRADWMGAMLLQWAPAPRTWTFAKRDREAVRALVNQLFNLDPALLVHAKPQSEAAARSLYAGVQQCALEVQGYLAAQAAGMRARYPEMGPGKTSGLYYFFAHGTYEVPLVWWLRHGVQHALRRQGALPDPTAHLDTVAARPLDAFDQRAVGGDLERMWNEDKVPLHTLWARANTGILLNDARIRAVLSSALGKVLEERLRAENAMYHVMCPNDITMAQRPYSQAGGAAAAGAHCDKFEAHVAALHGGAIAMRGRTNVAVGRVSLSSQFLEPLVRGEPAAGARPAACDRPYATSLHGANLNVLRASDKASLYTLLYEAILAGGGDMLTVYDPMDPAYRSMTQAELQAELPGLPGIPVAKIRFDEASLRALVGKHVAAVVAARLGQLDTAEPPACVAGAAGVQLTPLLPVAAETPQASPRAPECLYDRYNLPSMQAEGEARGWDAAGDATLRVFAESGLAEPSSSVGMCARGGDRAPWGRSHPNRADGMPCSIHDVGGGAPAGLDAEACRLCDSGVSSAGAQCHRCERAAGAPGAAGLNPEERPRTAQTCRLSDNSDHDDAGRYRVFDQRPGFQAPRLHSEGGTRYTFNADMYAAAAGAGVPRATGSVCHRADSGCVTGHDRGTLSKLFRYDGAPLTAGEHPARAAARRVDRNAFEQVSVPRLEDADRQLISLSWARMGRGAGLPASVTSFAGLEHWWKRDRPITDVNEEMDPAFFSAGDPLRFRAAPAAPESGTQCNIRRLDAPRGVHVAGYTLNNAPEHTGADGLADYSHLLFSDRVLFSRNDGAQLLFGHHFASAAGRAGAEQSTVGAPGASFCPGPRAALPADSRPLHWFRIVDWAAVGRNRLNTSMYRWDQDFGLKSTASDEGNQDKSGLAASGATLSCAEAHAQKKNVARADCTRRLSTEKLWCGAPPDTGPECSYLDSQFKNLVQSGYDGSRNLGMDQNADAMPCGFGVCCGQNTEENTFSKNMQASYCPLTSTPGDMGRCQAANPAEYGAQTSCRCYKDNLHDENDRELQSGTCDLAASGRIHARNILVKTTVQEFERQTQTVNLRDSHRFARFDQTHTADVGMRAWLDTPVDPGGRRCPVVDPRESLLIDGVLLNHKWSDYISTCAGEQATPERSDALDYATCALGSQMPAPGSEAGFDVFGLSVCWEQDVYEAANVRPWWSLSVGEMLAGWMDRSSSLYAYRHWLGFNVPAFTMREFMYPYKYKDRRWRVGVGSKFPKRAGQGIVGDNQVCWMGQGPPGLLWQAGNAARPDKHCDVKRFANGEDVGIDFRGDSIRRNDEAKFFNVESLFNAGWKNLAAAVDMDVFTQFLARIMASSATPPVNKLLGRHLWYDGAYSGAASAPLRFAPCLRDFAPSHDAALVAQLFGHLLPAAQVWDARGYAALGGDKNRYITKPTQWAEMDGSPGRFLAPCHPACRFDAGTGRMRDPEDPAADRRACGQCFHILAGGDAPPAATWDAPAGAPGACSYRATLEPGHFCSSLRAPGFAGDDGLCAREAAGAPNSFYPVSGRRPPAAAPASAPDDGAVFRCGACAQYAQKDVVLANRMLDETAAAPTFSSCAGCGLYRQQGGASQEYQGPYSQEDAGAVAGHLAAAMWATLQEDGVAARLQKHIEEGDEYSLDFVRVPDAGAANQTVVTLLVALQHGRMPAIPASISEQLDLLWGKTQRSSAGAGCAGSAARCAGRFPGFDSEVEYGHGQTLRESLLSACTEDALGEIQGMVSCMAGAGTAPPANASSPAAGGKQGAHLRRLVRYAEDTLRQEYGMRVPQLLPDAAARLEFGEGEHVDWTGGVLPFFAHAERDESEVFVRSLLGDMDANCALEYSRNFNVLARPCVKDRDNRIAVVNPWLGGNYSFFTMQHAAVVDHAEQHTRKTAIGFDTCSVRDADRSADGAERETRVPCGASACLYTWTNSSRDENRTVCRFSAGIDADTQDELPTRPSQRFLAKIYGPEYVYAPRPASDLCGRMFDRSAGQQCAHTQAPLGYMPHKMREAHAREHDPAAPPPSDGYARMPHARVFRDVFAADARPGLEHSQWAQRDAQHFLAHSAGAAPGALYAPLAVDFEQLAPRRVGLAVSAQGFLHVASVGLDAGAGAPPAPDARWLRELPADVRRDAATIAQNPLYAQPCAAGAACAHAHWACPYMRNAVFGGARAARALHPSVHLLTPDPTRMGRLYGGGAAELGGAHPLLRVRAVEARELREYAQIGAALFLRRGCGAVGASARFEKVRAHAAALLRNTLYALFSTGEAVPGCSGANAPPADMDWPHMRGTLRSGEAYAGRNGAADTPRDAGARMQQRFRVWVSSKGAVTTPRTAEPVYDERTPGANARTTLDPGGDCHRDYLLRATPAQVALLRAHEKCYVVARSAAERTLRCESAWGGGAAATTNITLRTTRLATRSLAQMRTLAPRFLEHAACANYSSARAHPVRTEFAGEDGRTYAAADELSMGRRVRISPLLNLIQQRTRAAPEVAALFALQTHRQLWEQALPRRLANARWADARAGNASAADARAGNASAAAAAGVRLPWQAASDVAGGAACAGLRAFLDATYSAPWRARPESRNALCMGMGPALQAFRAEQGCAAPPVTDRAFDMCSLAAFDGLCAALYGFKMQVAAVNAWANQQTEHTAMLYTPSVFVRADGRFVWHSIAASYLDLKLVAADGGSCAALQVPPPAARATSLEQSACPGQQMVDALQMLVVLRKYVIKIVDILFKILELGLEFVSGVVFTLAGDAVRGGGGVGMQMSDVLARAAAAFHRALALLMDLLVEWADMFLQFMKMLWSLIRQQGPVNDMLLLVESLCGVVKALIHGLIAAIAGIVAGLNQALGVFGVQISTGFLAEWERQAASLTCSVVVEECPGGVCPDSSAVPSIVASACGAALLGDRAPVGVLNEYTSAYTCSPASFCHAEVLSLGADALSVAGALPVLCAACPGALFGCEPATKQCTCGPPPQPAARCLQTEECLAPGALCDVQGDVWSVSDGTRACVFLQSQAVANTGAAFCYKSAVASAQGVCTLFSKYTLASTASCSANVELGAPVGYGSTGVCLGTHEQPNARAMVRARACFLYRCSQNTLDSPPLCAQVTDQSVMLTLRKTVWFNARGGAARRLLDAHGSSTLVEAFLRVAAPRVHELPEGGACRGLLRACLPAGPLSAECRACGARWLFWNITLHGAAAGAVPADARMLDAREAATRMLLDPALAARVVLTAPHALLVLLEDWLHDTAAFAEVLRRLALGRAALERTALALGSAGLRRRAAPQRAAPPQAAPGNRSGAPPPAPGRRSGARRALLAEASVFTRARVLPAAAAHPDFAGAQFGFLRQPGTADPLLYQLGVLDLPAGLDCIVSGSTMVAYVARDIIKSFERDGWTAKKICDGEVAFPMACPLVEGAVQHVVESTAVLVRYYTFLAYQTDCMRSMYASCLPRAAANFSTITESFPRIRPANRSSGAPRARAADPPDPLVDTGMAALRSALAWLSISQVSIEDAFMGLVSLDAMYDDPLYRDMRRRNEFSLGSLFRDFVQCDLDEIVSCRVRNSRLPVIILTNLVMIFVITTVFPVPSVLVFYLWTLGMTLGVVYMAYGFSPMCLPRIPTCLGEGLFDLVISYVFPHSLALPAPLYNATVCDSRLAPRAAGVCLLPCAGAPMRVASATSVFVAIDCAVFEREAVVSRFVLAALPAALRALYDEDYVMGTVRHFEAVFQGGDEALHAAVRVCIATNVFKLVLVACIAVVLLPVAIFALQFVLTLGGVVLTKGVAILSSLTRLCESIARA